LRQSGILYMKTEYLFFNLLIFLFATFLSGIVKSRKLPSLKPALFSILTISTPYIIWDFFVTNVWWSFNERYIVGLRVWSLPIEELFFFLTVPWSCLVLWVNLERYFSAKLSMKVEAVFFLIGLVICYQGALQNWNYTFLIGFLVSAFSLWSAINDFWLSNFRSFMYIFLVVIFTLIFNGYLTARPIVTYNLEVMSGVKVMTIPIEDFGYGIVLVGSVAMLYDFFKLKLSFITSHLKYE
jgi:lycopene cyclase domain-containing protein